jgi:hypothetical protein
MQAIAAVARVVCAVLRRRLLTLVPTSAAVPHTSIEGGLCSGVGGVGGARAVGGAGGGLQVCVFV